MQVEETEVPGHKVVHLSIRMMSALLYVTIRQTENDETESLCEVAITAEIIKISFYADHHTMIPTNS